MRNVSEEIKNAWTYAENHTSKFVDDLKEIVAQPSVSAQNIGLKECAELVRAKMAALGFTASLLPISGAPDAVFGELKSSNKNSNTLVIYNHYDVQPAEPLDEWNSEPFTPVEKDGNLYGREVGDDKGELVARFSAVESLLNSGSSMKPNVKWFVEGEEEVGSLISMDLSQKTRLCSRVTDVYGRQVTVLPPEDRKYTWESKACCTRSFTSRSARKTSTPSMAQSRPILRGGLSTC